MTNTLKKRVVAVLAATAFGAAPLHAANILINNVDAPEIGFNDPTPVEPVGGNHGTTLGEQRLIVFQTAANIWGSRLKSDVDIVVQATFQPLNCTPTGGTLGAAGPIQVFGFPPETAPPEAVPDTWYAVALANSIAGVDLAPGEPDQMLFDPAAADDIVAFFNGAIGTDPNCLVGLDWYNGLDNNQAPNEIDLLAVVMHEISHGLGFLELVDEGTGALFFGMPDIYSRNMLDTNQGLLFSEMDDAQRLQAQVAGDSLVWAGFRTTRKARQVLRAAPVVRTFFPRSVRGRFVAQAASFGAPLPKGQLGRAGFVKLADDGVETGSDGCEPLQNRVSFKIVLIDRGGCAFTTKALNAQEAGAQAVIIANNLPDGPAPVGGFDETVRIPTVGVTLEQGEAFKQALASKGLKSFVFVRLFGDRRRLAGADENGFVQLFAPDPVQPGSSKSHFDVSAVPNLLMEPAINPDLNPVEDFDLTDDLFFDIGWRLKRIR